MVPTKQILSKYEKDFSWNQQKLPYLKPLQSPSPNINDNEPSNEEKKLRNNKA